MKKTTFFILSGIVLIMFVLLQCKSKKEETIFGIIDKLAHDITPVPLPINIMTGFHFPEDSTVINKWTSDTAFENSYDSASIYKHAWGLWAGLTAQSGQTFANDSLLVYETWLSINEVRELIINNKKTCDSFKRMGRAPLSRPKQFEHAARFAAKKASLAFNKAPIVTASEKNINFWVTVSYSPDAACYATQNKIFKQSVINTYYKSGEMGAIPSFPTKSMTIKPTYMVYTDTNALFKLPVWITAPVPPDNKFTSHANSFVFVDKKNKQVIGKVPVPVDSSEKNVNKIAAATVNLSEFIYLIVDQQMADEMNKQDSIQVNNSNGGKAKKGQIALLVAMHVTTKEIKNWTWQSYYWTPNRIHPGSPSSNLAASLRPAQIKGAAANYACVAAYVMLTTPNKISNSNANRSMFGYNPYLEAGFDSTTFTFANTYNSSYKYGVQSNCMSCHALAIADIDSSKYTTDQQINLKDARYFKNHVSLDFAWSVQSALIPDSTLYRPTKK